MLSEAFGSSQAVRQAARGDGDDSLVSEGSTTSIGTEDEGSSFSQQDSSATLQPPPSANKEMSRSTHSDTVLGQKKAKQLVPEGYGSRNRANSLGPDLVRSKHLENGESHEGDKRKPTARRRSLDANMSPESTDPSTAIRQSPSPTDDDQDRKGVDGMKPQVGELTSRARPRSATVASGSSRVVGRSKLVDVEIKATPEPEKEVQYKVKPYHLSAAAVKSRPRSATIGSVTSPTSPKRGKSPLQASYQKEVPGRKISDGTIRTERSKELRAKELGAQSRPRSATNPRTLSSPTPAGQVRKPVKPLPTIRPVSAKPSEAVIRLAQQKKEEEDANVVTVDTEVNATDGMNGEKQAMVNGRHDEDRDVRTEEEDIARPGDSNSQTPSGQGKGTPVHKKSLEVS